MRVLFALLALAAIVSVSAQGLTGPNFYIIGAVPNTDYRLDLLNGTILPDPTLTLTVGTTYKFIINASMNIHPFGFSADNTDTITMGNLTGAAQGGLTSSGSCAAGTNSNPLSWITTDTANPCILSITPPATAVGIPIYYRCSVHSAMFGTLNIVAAAGTTTNPPTGTTSPPTGTTTQPPTGTTQPPTSTGKNSAAIIVPGAAAVIIAAINVIFSA